MEQSKNSIFSPRIVALSLLFMLANAAFYFLLFSSSRSGPPEPLGPWIAFSGSAPQIASPYAPSVGPAQQGQLMMVGASLSTGPGQFAEILLGGNAVRLDENTQLVLLQNNLPPEANGLSWPSRLAFRLQKGSLWIKASDPILVLAPRVSLHLQSASGAFFHSPEGLNRSMVFSGTGDLALYGEDQRPIASLALPLFSQATFLDASILPDFALLQPSKLKKELRVSPLSKEVMQDPWVLANQAVDGELPGAALEPIHSFLGYAFRQGANGFRSTLSFYASGDRRAFFARAKNILRYWSGGVAEGNSLKRAQALERSWKALSPLLEGPEWSAWRRGHFFALPWGEADSAQFLLKRMLLSELSSPENARILRAPLAQARWHLSRNEPAQADRLAELWLSEWKALPAQSFPEEMGQQLDMVRQLALAYADRISLRWLSLADEASALAAAGQPAMEDFSLSLTQERLDAVAALLGAYRYGEAKQYLKASYLALQQVPAPALSASQEVFLQMGKLLAQRIEYAQTELRSSPVPIDEEAFRLFIQKKNRDELLSSDLKSFLSDGEPVLAPSDMIHLPSAEEALAWLAEAGIRVSASGIEPLEGRLVFSLKGAELSEAGKDLQVFDALYDPFSASFSQILTQQGRALKGSFALSDLKSALRPSEILPSPGEGESADPDTLLSQAEQEEAGRQQAVAEGVAQRLAMAQLEKAGFLLASPKVLEVLDPLGLDRFSVRQSALRSQDGLRNEEVSFRYDSSSQELSEIAQLPAGEPLLDRAGLAEARERIFAALDRRQEESAALDLLKKALEGQPVKWEPSQVRFLSPQLLQLPQIRLLAPPLDFSGLFDASAGSFSVLSHSLHSGYRVTMEEYLSGLLLAYAKSLFAQQGLPTETGQWSALPASAEVSAEGYSYGNFEFSFLFDAAAGRFKRLEAKGPGWVVEDAEFEDLKSLAFK